MTILTQREVCIDDVSSNNELGAAVAQSAHWQLRGLPELATKKHSPHAHNDSTHNDDNTTRVTNAQTTRVQWLQLRQGCDSTAARLPCDMRASNASRRKSQGVAQRSNCSGVAVVTNALAAALPGASRRFLKILLNELSHYFIDLLYCTQLNSNLLIKHDSSRAKLK